VSIIASKPAVMSTPNKGGDENSTLDTRSDWKMPLFDMFEMRSEFVFPEQRQAMKRAVKAVYCGAISLQQRLGLISV
jgi:hypothetical protein